MNRKNITFFSVLMGALFLLAACLQPDDSILPQFSANKEANLVSINPLVLTKIKIVKQPDRAIYLTDDALEDIELAGLEVLAFYNNDTSSQITITVDDITGFDSSQPAKEQTLTVTYQDKIDTFSISIEDSSINKIRVTKQPARRIYYAGDTVDNIDLTGLEVFAYCDNGVYFPVTITTDHITGFDSAVPGKKTLTVTYKDKTDVFSVTMFPIVLLEISIKNPPVRTVYYVGDELDLTGLEVSAYHNNGTRSAVPVTINDITGFDSSRPGKKTITVTYQGKTAGFTVNVNAVILTEIKITKQPDKTVYSIGDSLTDNDLSGLVVTAFYNNGTSSPVPVTVGNITGFNSSITGNKNLTVTYRQKTAAFPIRVDEGVLTGIRITRVPVKKYYKMGEELAAGDLVVENVYHNGYSKPTSDYTITGDTFTAGSQNITVVSKINTSKTATFNINVSNDLIHTGLPVVYIDTRNAAPVVSKEEYINGKIVIKQNNVVIHENTMRIHGRGNATWSYPKKPYRIKLDTAANLLGMRSDRDWVLLANYCDKTLMRTSIAFHLSQLMQFPWTPKAKFVEVVLNGEYIGNYQLAEHVKKSSTRINIPNTGYFFQWDNYYYNEPKYFTTQYGYSFQYPQPEDLTDYQWEYLRSFMHEFETVLYSDNYNDPNTGYHRYIDIDSFVKWFLFQNIMANQDTNPFLTKNDNGASKVFMGPCVWDFEWSLGIGWYGGVRPRPANYYVYTDWYYSQLRKDLEFNSRLKSLWNENKIQVRQSILDFISITRVEIMSSQELNFRRWNILNTQVSVGGIPLGSFEAEVDCDIQFFNNHMDWLETVFNVD